MPRARRPLPGPGPAHRHPEPAGAAFTTTRVLEYEASIAWAIEGLADNPGRQVPTEMTGQAIADKEQSIGRTLTTGQRQLVEQLCASPGAASLVVGVAGADKTTALDAATTAMEQAGYRLIGTSTSGQAARTLGAEAGIESRTLESLLWRLESHQIQLGPTTVVIVDEAGMANDADLARLALAAQRSYAHLILVGDHHQARRHRPRRRTRRPHGTTARPRHHPRGQRPPTRPHTQLHATANNVDQAVDDLRTDWGAKHAQRWITPDSVEWQRQADDAPVGPTMSPRPDTTKERLAALESQLGDIARTVAEARATADGLLRRVDSPDLRRSQRRAAANELKAHEPALIRAEGFWAVNGAPIERDLQDAIDKTRTDIERGVEHYVREIPRPVPAIQVREHGSPSMGLGR